MIRVLTLTLLLLASPARGDDFDYVLRFANLATAKADAIAAADALNVDASDFASDHAMQVAVTRISTGADVPGFYVLISFPRAVPALLNHPALQVAIDRDRCKARLSGCIVRSTIGAQVLQDITISPVYMGSDFPWGGLK